MRTILTVIYNLLASMHPALRVGLGVGSILIAFLQYINALWADLFARVDALAVGSTGVADFSPLGFVNYVFPLDTVLTFCTSYCALRLVCAAIRIVKSFIPTIS